jgi:uncharacterized tellurite resistance protein B-like protein
MAGLLKVRNYTNSVFYTSSVNTTNMDYNRRNVDFQLGLLHFVHLLVTVDGKIDDREREAIHSIKGEEEIPGSVFHHFVRSITGKTEHEVYREGMRLLSQCNDEEKLSAFVHLYRLAQADEHLDVKEVKLLLYSIKETNIEFNDVVLTAQLALAQEQVRKQKRVA